ncbi:MAG: tetratricopeptide repeat protein, partial [Pseudomonadota bacterium]
RDMATNRQGLENLTFSLNGLATNLVDQGRFEEGLALHRESVELRQELFGENSPAYTIGLFNLGNTQLAAGDFAGAESWFSKALPLANKIFGAEHPRTGAVRFALGITQIRQGNPQGDHNAALGMEAVRRSEGADSVRYLGQRAALAEAQIEPGTAGAGLIELQRVWEQMVAVVGEDAPRSKRLQETIARLRGQAKPP